MGNYEHPPEGTRTSEHFVQQIPGTNVTFTNAPCADPLTDSKRLQQTLLGLEPVAADPNDISPHTDIIKETLKAKSKDPNASETDREQARQMLAQFFPETPPADPNARKTIWERAKELGI